MMAEHASVRLHVSQVKQGSTSSIYELDDFVRKCHARVEDEVIFPILERLFSSSGEEQLAKNLSRLEADHKLIDKIGDQLRAATVGGDEKLLEKRILLYANTVEVHNAGEEALAFPFWQDAKDAKEQAEIIARVKMIVDEFGRDRYFRITGISEKLLEQVK
jgi:hemerythrin superfamily protein